MSETADSVVALIESQAAWSILSLELPHLRALGEIAAFRDHTDPFDRMLIAQAGAEGLRIVTADEQFSRYDIDVVW
jgi:PIN domain nuclease of toxin-antitoxin system